MVDDVLAIVICATARGEHRLVNRDMNEVGGDDGLNRLTSWAKVEFETKCVSDLLCLGDARRPRLRGIKNALKLVCRKTKRKLQLPMTHIGGRQTTVQLI